MDVVEENKRLLTKSSLDIQSSNDRKLDFENDKENIARKKPHKCNVCDRAFIKPSHLKEYRVYILHLGLK